MFNSGPLQDMTMLYCSILVVVALLGRGKHLGNDSHRLVCTPTCCRVLRNRCVALSPSSLRLTPLISTRHSAGFGDNRLSKVNSHFKLFFVFFCESCVTSTMCDGSISNGQVCAHIRAKKQPTSQNHSELSTHSLNRDADHQFVLFCFSSHFPTAATQFKAHFNVYHTSSQLIKKLQKLRYIFSSPSSQGFFWFSVNMQLKLGENGSCACNLIQQQRHIILWVFLSISETFRCGVLIVIILIEEPPSSAQTASIGTAV